MNAPTCSSMRGADRERETGLDNWHALIQSEILNAKVETSFLPQNTTEEKENVEIGGKKSFSE